MIEVPLLGRVLTNEQTPPTEEDFEMWLDALKKAKANRWNCGQNVLLFLLFV